MPRARDSFVNDSSINRNGGLGNELPGHVFKMLLVFSVLRGPFFGDEVVTDVASSHFVVLAVPVNMVVLDTTAGRRSEPAARMVNQAEFAVRGAVRRLEVHSGNLACAPEHQGESQRADEHLEGVSQTDTHFSVVSVYIGVSGTDAKPYRQSLGEGSQQF